MKALKQTKLLKILILFVDILLFLVIIRECKVTSFCLTIFNLISPIIIGFGISWLIKPIMNYFNKNKGASKRNIREHKNILKRKLRIRAK